MQIWVDADACPRVIKDILYKAADRKKVQLTLVANQPLQTPASTFIGSMVVGSGFDVADDKIVELMQVGDLVITADIKGATDSGRQSAPANPDLSLYRINGCRLRV